MRVSDRNFWPLGTAARGPKAEQPRAPMLYQFGNGKAKGHDCNLITLKPGRVPKNCRLHGFESREHRPIHLAMQRTLMNNYYYNYNFNIKLYVKAKV